MNGDSPAGETAGPIPPPRGRLAVLLVIWALAAACLVNRIDSGWIPQDEGTLAQAAERVLQGELPHRDFDDPYVGGLAFLHAASFQLFGTRLLSIRITLLLGTLALVPVIYAIALRASSPWPAGMVTLLCLVWGPPNYFAGVPSWYNLIGACCGAYCLVRFVETDRRRWTFAAGLCGGLSILIKQVGLYFLAAALLFLVYHEQVTAAERGRPGNGRGYGWSMRVGLALFCIALLGLTSRRASPMGALHYLLPGVAAAGFLWWNESRLRNLEGASRWRTLLRAALPLALGCLAPIALFVVPYASTSSLGDLYRGVLIAPHRRFEYATLALPEPWTLVAVLPMVLLLAAGRWLAGRALQRVLLVPVAIALGLVLLLGANVAVYDGVWYSVRPLGPLLAIAGCILLAWSGAVDRLDARRRQHLFLLLAVVATTGLVQFPFAAGVYFCYVAPLVVLGLHHLVASQSRAPKLLHGCLLVFYLLWAVIWLNSADTFQLGFVYRPAGRMERLDLDRGGLRVPAADAALYRDLVREIQRLTPGGGTIYAAPDSPEVYFLSARKNPTRTFFDLFDEDYGDPVARSQRILETLDRLGVDVVVLRRQTEFSRFDPVLELRLWDRFPQRRDLGPFTVMWREPTGRARARWWPPPRPIDNGSDVLPSRYGGVAGPRERTERRMPAEECGRDCGAASEGTACPS